jgi:hypothetical protein
MHIGHGPGGAVCSTAVLTNEFASNMDIRPEMSVTKLMH